MPNEKMPERLERTVIYESEFVCLYTDKVRLPSGNIVEKYHQIHYPKESVCIAIFNEKDELLLIRNRRYTVGRLEWEIPAGRIEPGETAEEAAIRESREETGCELQDLKYLCAQNPANGMSDCTCHCFGARVRSEGNATDTDEVASKKWVSRSEVLKMLENNETKDGISMLGILYAFQFYKD